jgi:UDPglucose 6-dehydrogenase
VLVWLLILRKFYNLIFEFFYFWCVTDFGDGHCYFSYVEGATRRIAEVAKSSKIVVEKSTVPCRTAQSMRTILEANSTPGIRFDICSNPEFLAEGTAIKDLLNPDRVLIGALQTPEGIAAQKALADVYTHWVPSDRVITTNLWSSELTKLVSILALS